MSWPRRGEAGWLATVLGLEADPSARFAPLLGQGGRDKKSASGQRDSLAPVVPEGWIRPLAHNRPNFSLSLPPTCRISCLRPFSFSAFFGPRAPSGEAKKAKEKEKKEIRPPDVFFLATRGPGWAREWSGREVVGRPPRLFLPLAHSLAANHSCGWPRKCRAGLAGQSFVGRARPTMRTMGRSQRKGKDKGRPPLSPFAHCSPTSWPRRGKDWANRDLSFGSYGWKTGMRFQNEKERKGNRASSSKHSFPSPSQHWATLAHTQSRPLGFVWVLGGRRKERKGPRPHPSAISCPRLSFTWREEWQDSGGQWAPWGAWSFCPLFSTQRKRAFGFENKTKDQICPPWKGTGRTLLFSFFFLLPSFFSSLCLASQP